MQAYYNPKTASEIRKLPAGIALHVPTSRMRINSPRREVRAIDFAFPMR
jgi:hypothetical protein